MPHDQFPQRRVARLWRMLFGVYALALTLGTHWPRLDLGVGDIPAPDKVLHMLAFGGLALLLWRTRWITDILLIALLAAGWAVLDELSQGIAIFGRTISSLDIVWSLLGVAVATVWMWVLEPVGGQMNRLRLALVERALDGLILQKRVWVLLALAGGGAALAFGALAGWMFNRIDSQATLVAGLTAAAVGGAASGSGILHWALSRQCARVNQMHKCHECGSSCQQAAFDSAGLSACPTCGTRLYAGQWRLLNQPSREVQRATAGYGVVAFVGLAGLCVAAYMFLLIASTHVPWLAGLLDKAALSRIPADLRLAIDLSVLGLMLAIVVAVARRVRADFVDGQASTCMNCRHDLRQTPAPGGIGQCGECGWVFVKLAD